MDLTLEQLEQVNREKPVTAPAVDLEAALAR
jgi:hypothetical protein